MLVDYRQDSKFDTPQIMVEKMKTDSRALSAAPPRAILIWSDGRDLYTEFPGPDGAPIVIRYHLTATGLSQVLSLVKTRSFDCLDPQPIHQGNLTSRAPGTAAQRDNARAVIRRLGFIG
jgi:hypothetical protein